MLRILIVDDEKLILEGIQSIIENSLDLPFQYEIATALNAMEATNVYNSFKPDLILTDINMPMVDGLELISNLREKGNTANIVILTSHADFNYAQRAISLGVKEFILKPIDKKILEKTIINANEEKQNERLLELKDSLNRVRDSVLYNLSDDDLNINPDVIVELFPHLYFSVSVLILPRMYKTYAEDYRRILLKYYDICYCFCLPQRNQLIAICNFNNITLRDISTIVQQFKDVTKIDECCGGISICSESFINLHDLYTNAMQRAIVLQNVNGNKPIAEVSLYTFQDCIRIFEENDEQTVLYLLQEYVDKIRKLFDATVDMGTIYHSFFCNISLYLKIENSSYIPDNMKLMNDKEWDNKRLVLKLASELREIKKTIKIYADNDDKNKSFKLVQNMKNYIRSHYQDDVSLEDLAASVNLHPNYACKLFIETEGESFLSYLHKERIKVIKSMMQETNDTLETIAQKVGYNSATQMTRVFRKYEGVAPSAIRGKEGK